MTDFNGLFGAVRDNFLRYDHESLMYKLGLDCCAGPHVKTMREIILNEVILPQMNEAPGEPFACDNGVFVRLPPYGPRLYTFEVRARRLTALLLTPRAGIRAAVPGNGRERCAAGRAAHRHQLQELR